MKGRWAPRLRSFGVRPSFTQDVDKTSIRATCMWYKRGFTLHHLVSLKAVLFLSKDSLDKKTLFLKIQNDDVETSVAAVYSDFCTGFNSRSALWQSRRPWPTSSYTQSGKLSLIKTFLGTLKPQRNGRNAAIRWLVHWPLMGGLLHLVQRGGDCVGCGPVSFSVKFSDQRLHMTVHSRIFSHFGDIQRQRMAWPWNVG